MASASETSGTPTLMPDQAFNALGNTVRIRILRALGEADSVLSYTELRDRVGLDEGDRFNYHLDRLVGHFVAKSEDGYELRQPGRAVVQAVLSGAITEDPRIDRTGIDASCQLCSAPIEIRYKEDRVETYCTECSGVWGPYKQGEPGYLGGRFLPPAGIQDRSPYQIYRTAWAWTMRDIFSMGQGICPACSAQLDYDILLCDHHDQADEFCDECNRRYAARIGWRCSNCIFGIESTFPVCVATNTDLLEFMLSNGLNPIDPDEIPPVQRVFSDYEEEILSADPPEIRLTFSVGTGSVTLRVNDDLEVIEAGSEI